MSNGLSMRKWLKGAHVSGVQEGSPAAVGGQELTVRDKNSTEGRPRTGGSQLAGPAPNHPSRTSHANCKTFPPISTRFSQLPPTYSCRRPLPNTAHVSTFEPFPHTKPI